MKLVASSFSEFTVSRIKNNFLLIMLMSRYLLSIRPRYVSILWITIIVNNASVRANETLTLLSKRMVKI